MREKGITLGRGMGSTGKITDDVELRDILGKWGYGWGEKREYEWGEN